MKIILGVPNIMYLMCMEAMQSVAEPRQGQFFKLWGNGLSLYIQIILIVNK